MRHQNSSKLYTYFCAIGLDLFIPYTHMLLMLHLIDIIVAGALNFIHFYINHYFTPLLVEYDYSRTII
jgi:hypothetical protein